MLHIGAPAGQGLPLQQAALCQGHPKLQELGGEVSAGAGSSGRTLAAAGNFFGGMQGGPLPLRSGWGLQTGPCTKPHPALGHPQPENPVLSVKTRVGHG